MTTIGSDAANDAPVIPDAADEPFVLGDAGCGTNYPAGPYGTKVGDVIAPLAFAGKTDSNQNGIVSDDPTGAPIRRRPAPRIGPACQPCVAMLRCANGASPMR